MAAYQYSIDGTNFQNTTTFNGVDQGITYNVTVRSTADNSCISNPTQVAINTAPTAPVAPTASVTTQPTCTNVNSGGITVTAPIGGGFEYSIDGTNYQVGTTFINLGPGPYNVTVRRTADNTCVSNPIVLNVDNAVAPANPVISVTTQPSCASTTGTVSVTGADPALEYSIDGGATWVANGIFPGLTPNTYTVIARAVTDHSCASGVSNTVTVDNVTTPSAPTATVAQPACGATTGTITVAPLDPTLEYSIDGGTTWVANGVFTELPGNYFIIAEWSLLTACVSGRSAQQTVNTPTAAPEALRLAICNSPACLVVQQQVPSLWLRLIQHGNTQSTVELHGLLTVCSLNCQATITS